MLIHYFSVYLQIDMSLERSHLSLTAYRFYSNRVYYPKYWSGATCMSLEANMSIQNDMRDCKQTVVIDNRGNKDL